MKGWLLAAALAATSCGTPPAPEPPKPEPAPEPAPPPPPAPSAEPVSPDTDLSWLRGCWRGEEDGSVTVERWGPNRDGGLVGESRTTKNGELVHREYLMIKRTPDGITLTAFPKGQPHAVFDAVEAGDRRIVFANPEHDYPQRIAYWADGDAALHARIEGAADDPSRSSEWHWTKASGPDCKIGR